MIESMLENIDIWVTAYNKKASTGRGRGSNIDPVGLNNLKSIILNLAIQGKLTKGESYEESADLLLDRITKTKNDLVEKGLIKKFKKIPDVDEDEKEFQLPDGWVWTRLGNVINFVNGYAFKSSSFVPDGVEIVKIGDIQAGEISKESMSKVPEDLVSNLDPCLRVENGDLVIAMSGATTGKLGINYTDETFYLNQRVGKIIPFEIDTSFLCYVLTTKVEENLKKSSGSAIPNLSTNQVNNIIIPLPPLSQQKTIAKKLDELMLHCDTLGKSNATASIEHAKMVQSFLDALVSANSREELDILWRTFSENFELLFSTKNSIKKLEQTILQLAVMGKLVDQLPDEKPASFFIEKIKEDKERLVKSGKVKKQKPLPQINEDAFPFSVPSGWSLVHLEDICELITDGTHQTPNYVEKGKPFLSAKNIKPFRFMPEDHKFVSKEDFESLRKNRTPAKGDILLTRVGSNIGEAAVIDTDFEFAFYVSLGILKLFKDYVSPDFITIWLNSPLGTSVSAKNTLGRGHSAGNLNLSLIRGFVVCMPGLEEQKRIVTKVNKLRELCKLLLERIEASKSTQVKLAESFSQKTIESMSHSGV